MGIFYSDRQLLWMQRAGKNNSTNDDVIICCVCIVCKMEYCFFLVFIARDGVTLSCNKFNSWYLLFMTMIYRYKLPYTELYIFTIILLSIFFLHFRFKVPYDKDQLISVTKTSSIADISVKNILSASAARNCKKWYYDTYHHYRINIQWSYLQVFLILLLFVFTFVRALVELIWFERYRWRFLFNIFIFTFICFTTIDSISHHSLITTSSSPHSVTYIQSDLHVRGTDIRPYPFGRNVASFLQCLHDSPYSHSSCQVNTSFYFIFLGGFSALIFQ